MSKTKSAPAAPTRKQLSRAARERRQEQYIRIGVAVIAVIVLGLLGFGLVDQAVIQPRQPVARVNGAAISTAEFQKMVRYQRFQLLSQYAQFAQAAELFGSDPQTQQYFQGQQQQIVSQLTDSQSLGQQAINTLVEDRLIRQEAARRGITVSAEEVEAKIRELFEFFPNGTPTPTLTPSPFPTDVPPTVDPTRAAQWTPTPTLTPTATFTPTATPTPGPTDTPRPTATAYTLEGYNQLVTTYTTNLKTQANLAEADFRYFIESELYRDKLIAAFGAEAPLIEDQVHARHILVSSSDTDTEEQKTAARAKIDEVAAKLKAGEDWTALAAQYSEDSSAQTGGDLGWHGHDYFVQEFSDAAFNLSVGATSDPVKTQFGWHIIQVLGREERSLTPAQLEDKRQQAFQTWLDSQKATDPATGQPTNYVIYDAVWQDRVPTEPSFQ
ncbi:MAG: peptidylprolyl isomerase [Anaerolineales bacterium]